MATATRILAIRHGQSEWNAQGRWQGHADPPLTETGLLQAYEAAQALGTFDAVWASTLQRAAHTAAVIAEVLGIGPVQLDANLMEAGFGPWQGLTVADIEKGWPGYIAEQRRPDGAEPVDRVAERGMTALRTIAATTPGGEVLAVTHAGLVRVVAAAAGVPGVRVSNLGGCWFTVQGDGSITVGDTVRLIEPEAGPSTL